MSDEIICSECSRPNLPEAEKCWYCQTPLKETVQGDLGIEYKESAEEIPVEASSEGEPEIERNIEDIPEWLKRVRELKSADQPEEEEDDQWRQQILFASQENEKMASKKPGGTKPRPVSKPAADVQESHPQNEEQPIPSQDQRSLDSESPKLDPSGTGSDLADESNDVLPDGFTPLDTKKG